MVIEISPGVIIAGVLAYVGPALAFIIWVKTEINVIKNHIKNQDDQRVEEQRRNEKLTDEMKIMMHELSRKVDSMNTTLGSQLYDLNTKITRTETMAEVLNAIKSKQ